VRQRTIFTIFPRLVAAGTLVIASLSLTSPAAAGEVESTWFTRTIINVNPCVPEDGLVTINFEVHGVTRQLADGTFLIHGNYHGTGSSTSGTEYVVNRQEWFTVDGAGAGSGTFRVIRITKGSIDNVQIEGTFTFPPMTVSSTFRCVG
jgi:hypothetical protein